MEDDSPSTSVYGSIAAAKLSPEHPDDGDLDTHHDDASIDRPRLIDVTVAARP